MTARGRGALHLLVVFAVLALLVVVARGVSWRAVLAAVRDADPWLLLAALVCNLASLAAKGVRWWVFLRPLGVRSLALVLRAPLAGASLNNHVVAQGGVGARVLMVSRATGVSSARVLSALMLERGLDMVSYLVLLVAGAWLLPLAPAITRWRTDGTLLLGGAATVLLALGARSGRASRTVTSCVDAERSYLHRFTGGLAEIGSPPRLTAGLLLSLVAWTLQVATYHLGARAAGLPLPLAGSVAALLSVGISFLVRATPGNVGVFQAVYALTMRPFGIAEDAAIATALLIQAVQVVPTAVVGGGWWVLGKRWEVRGER